MEERATDMSTSAASVAEVPPGVSTVTSTGPAAPAGLVAVISVLESTVKEVAGVAPKSPGVAPENPEPGIVTMVPPAVGPSVRLNPVTAGAATYVK